MCLYSRQEPFLPIPTLHQSTVCIIVRQRTISFIKMTDTDQQTLLHHCSGPPDPTSRGKSHSIFKSFDNPFFIAVQLKET